MRRKMSEIEIPMRDRHCAVNEVRRLLKSATEVAFSDEGWNWRWSPGGDIWVMDTILREPQR